jgi:hypothetical protein
MNKSYFKVFWLILILIFLITKTSCLFDTIGNFFKDIKELRDIVNNRRSDNRTVKSRNRSRIHQENHGLEFYNLFFRMLKNTNRQIRTTFEYIYSDFVNNIDNKDISKQEKKETHPVYNYKNEKKIKKKNQFFVRRKTNEDSIFEKLIISDIMLIYSLAEIFLSLSIAFIIIPTIVILRKWIKSIHKNKIKEVNMYYSEFKTTFHKNSLEDEDCSICLDKILYEQTTTSTDLYTNNINTPQVNNIQDKTLSHLDCGHLYHANCIKEWISRSKDTCPFCRKEIETITHVD